MRSYRFRVAFFGSLQPLGGDEEKPPSTALKCYDVKRVQRNRKAQNKAEISIPGNELSNESLNKTQVYLLDDLGDDWSDYDFDANSDDGGCVLHIKDQQEDAETILKGSFSGPIRCYSISLDWVRAVRTYMTVRP